MIFYDSPPYIQNALQLFVASIYIMPFITMEIFELNTSFNMKNQ